MSQTKFSVISCIEEPQVFSVVSYRRASPSGYHVTRRALKLEVLCSQYSRKGSVATNISWQEVVVVELDIWM